jgi:hypothetical protein
VPQLAAACFLLYSVIAPTPYCVRTWF